MAQQKTKNDKKNRKVTTTSKDHPAPTTNQTQTSSPSLGLRTKYYSIVPLHVFLINFTIYYLPCKVIQSQDPSSSSSQIGQDGQRPATREDGASTFNRFILLMVHQPILSLSIINLGALLVQVWFITFLNSWKKSIVSSSSNSPSSKRTTTNSLIPPIQVFKSLATFDLQKLRRIDPVILNFYNQIWLVIKEATIIHLIITLLINLIIILLGGSIKSTDKNLLLSSLISILSFFPASIILTWNQARQKSNWIRIFSSFKPKNDLEIALLGPAFGVCLGTWLGAIPIPLDWDRPWQGWPITCVIGASLGHSVGSVVSMIWCSLFTPT